MSNAMEKRPRSADLWAHSRDGFRKPDCRNRHDKQIESEVRLIASEKKFTNDAMSSILQHNDRGALEPSNTDIDPARSHLNYSFEMDHGGLSDFDYYKNLIDGKYLYGRGSKREDKAITGCGWVVTAPKEICGDPAKERAFFSSVYSFVSNRYGKENIIQNAVHYDEAGAPHIHIVFCPVTVLDHDKVKYKTVKTKEAVRMESGRYEFGYRFKLDAEGNKIPLKNYAKMSDYYDEKIAANDVLNKLELRHFHGDLQKFLDDNGVEGRVLTGTTGGVNFTVKELKDFTAKTGLRLDEVREMQGDRTLLESYVVNHAKVADLEALLSEKNAVIESLKDEITAKDRSIELSSDTKDEILRKDEQIKELTKDVTDRDRKIVEATGDNLELQQKAREAELSLALKQREFDRTNAALKDEILQKDGRIQELTNTVTDKDRELDALKNRNHELRDRVREAELAVTTKQHEFDRTSTALKDEILQKDSKIQELSKAVSDREQKLVTATGNNQQLEQKIRSLEHSLSEKQHELNQANEKIRLLEAEKTVEASRPADRTEANRTEHEHGWGNATSSWSDRSQSSSWGTHNTDIEEDKTW